MERFFILVMVAIFSCGVITANQASAEIDPINDISFLQTGIINTPENQFQISNDMNIREFSNGKIVRISGQTIEGFSYITYSEILNDRITTNGKIFINSKSIHLLFEEVKENTSDFERKNDITILVQYTQRVYSETLAKIDVKVFHADKIIGNNFFQNYGQVPNTNITITVTNSEDQEIHSFRGLTSNAGLFEAEFFIPENSRQETITARIDAYNENSETSKILQIFNLGRINSSDD